MPWILTQRASSFLFCDFVNFPEYLPPDLLDGRDIANQQRESGKKNEWSGSAVVRGLRVWKKYRIPSYNSGEGVLTMKRHKK
jgi:hypothetical protein